MKFDKSRVYTAVNAEELKVGSKVIISDTIATLELKVKKWVEGCTESVHNLVCIRDKGEHSRFQVEMGSSWMLAYLVEEPEDEGLKWTDLKVGDIIETKNKRFRYIITGIDYNNLDGFPDNYKHIQIHNCWISDYELKKYELVNYGLGDNKKVKVGKLTMIQYTKLLLLGIQQRIRRRLNE